MVPRSELKSNASGFSTKPGILARVQMMPKIRNAALEAWCGLHQPASGLPNERASAAVLTAAVLFDAVPPDTPPGRP